MESNVINHPESVQKGAEGERTEAEEPEPMASSIPLLPVMFGFRFEASFAPCPRDVNPATVPIGTSVITSSPSAPFLSHPHI